MLIALITASDAKNLEDQYYHGSDSFTPAYYIKNGRKQWFVPLVQKTSCTNPFFRAMLIGAKTEENYDISYKYITEQRQAIYDKSTAE